MLQLSNAVFITLSVLLVVECRRCYWCGPMADQVHRSRRAPPCDAPSPLHHLTTCEHDLTHCAVIATSPPYIESRICVKIYQDECYPLFCNSTKTWKMTCPCRGDLCNGFITDRENEAFTYLAKLVKKTSRIRRATIATPKFIRYREKTLTNDDVNDDNKILQLNGNHSGEIVLSTNDAKMGTSDSQIVTNDAVTQVTTHVSVEDNKDGGSDMQSDEPVTPVAEEEIVIESTTLPNPQMDNNGDIEAARSMDTASLVTSVLDILKSSHATEATMPAVIVDKPAASDSQIVTNDAVTQVIAHVSVEDNKDSDSDMDMQSDEPVKPVAEKEIVIQNTALSNPQMENNGDMKVARSMDTASLVTNTLDILKSSHATEATKPAVIVDKTVALDIQPSGESSTAESNSQNISPTKKIEELTMKRIDLDESPKEKAVLTEKTPVDTITEPSYTSSTIDTLEVTTKSSKNNAVTIYIHFYNYVSWMTLFFI